MRFQHCITRVQKIILSSLLLPDEQTVRALRTGYTD
jgi:hypothetical protein